MKKQNKTKQVWSSFNLGNVVCYSPLIGDSQTVIKSSRNPKLGDKRC